MNEAQSGGFTLTRPPPGPYLSPVTVPIGPVARFTSEGGAIAPVLAIVPDLGAVTLMI